MTALELFHEATRRGLTLKPAGLDRLAVIPARLCPPEFADILREHKPELLSLLSVKNPNNLPEVLKPPRQLTERERVLLIRFCGTRHDPFIIEAINLFNATIVGIKAASVKRCKLCAAEFYGWPESKFCSSQCWQKSLLEPLDKKARLKSCLNYLRDFEARLERTREDTEQRDAEL